MVRKQHYSRILLLNLLQKLCHWSIQVVDHLARSLMHVDEVQHHYFSLILISLQEIPTELEHVFIGVFPVETSSKDGERTHVRTETVLRIVVVRVASESDALMVSRVVHHVFHYMLSHFEYVRLAEVAAVASDEAMLLEEFDD